MTAVSAEKNASDLPRDGSHDAAAYLIDAWQRSILFWDTMRRRGDIAMERASQGHPPVLKYKYELMIDGGSLPRPVNYMLLRILPPTPMDPNARTRPFIIIDPRAGHGPGIGGFKEDSEIGFALRAGHPVYFVSFLPRPVPGQTLEDIRTAEAVFVEEVARRHPEADKPCVIANCQAGWAVAMLASVRPEIMGPIILSGAPLAYWSGASGQNPMRYSGGLLGGKWLESLACDLGNGLFDGAYLVQNFEILNPANSLWGKYYGLYSAIDTESERFLDFESWWTGYFLVNAEEMDVIISDLFIGNKLSRGMITTADHKKMDLSSIRSPVVIFASRGDNISPPQQALNWIEDVYRSESVLIECGRVIIYLLHPTVGHLGVFVSGDVARKEYSQIIGTLEMIDALPPGLYEMKIEPGASVPGWEELGNRQYSVRFESRTIKDIHDLDDSREEESKFAAVETVSKIADAAYETFARPWIRLFTSDFTAEAIRQLQPPRIQRTLLSSVNPFLDLFAGWAPVVRECRQRVSDENPFRVQEQLFSELVISALNAYRDLRDSWYEFVFNTAYGPLGWGALFPAPVPAQSVYLPEEPFNIPEGAWTSGGQLAATLRMVAAVSLDTGVFDNRSLLIFKKLLSNSVFEDVTPTEAKAGFRLQATLLRRDPERAIESLKDMLMDEGTKRDAVNTVTEILKAVPEAAEMKGPLGMRIRGVLGLATTDQVWAAEKMRL